MSEKVNQVNWRTFFAGLMCGLLAACVGFYFLYPRQATQRVGATTTIAVPTNERLALPTVSTRPGLAIAERVDSPPVQLRPANFPCDKETIEKAVKLKRAGWTYIMPQPKSAQARWGNGDGRTTWWVGYWVNEGTNATSSVQPERTPDGQWIGDGKGIRFWRRGGSPLAPTKIEWLCSTSGGITPQ